MAPTVLLHLLEQLAAQLFGDDPAARTTGNRSRAGLGFIAQGGKQAFQLAGLDQIAGREVRRTGEREAASVTQVSGRL